MDRMYQFLIFVGFLLIIEGILHVLEFHAWAGMAVLLTGVIVAVVFPEPEYHVHGRGGMWR
ncbi:MAG: hypothetical protein HQM03_13515 [Magnetococcales bacterium]|nr:hypothetical protein [Magnetococcales bacterium]